MKKRNAKTIRGEVFTPTGLVNDMLDKLPATSFTQHKTFLDHSCGSGNFLLNILERKMAHGCSHEDALRCLFGVEIDPSNVETCKKRLLGVSLSPSQEAQDIVNSNIICADALDPDHEGWKDIGYFWENV